MNELIDILHRGKYSCVISHNEEIRTYHQRGVADLWQLCQDSEEFLLDAKVADKVIGKGAAALMVYGGVSEVYADVISQPALDLLRTHNIRISYQQLTDRILNRRTNGLCPVESLCVHIESINEMVKTISNFINKNA